MSHAFHRVGYVLVVTAEGTIRGLQLFSITQGFCLTFINHLQPRRWDDPEVISAVAGGLAGMLLLHSSLTRYKLAACM